MDHQHPLRLTDGILRFRGPGSVHLHRHDNTPPSKKKRMFRSRATPKLRGIEAVPRPSNPCSSTWAKWRVGVCGVASPSSTWRSWAGCGGLSFQQPPREKRGILCNNNNTIIFILSVPIMASRPSIYKQVASAAPLMSPRARDLTSGERHVQQHIAAVIPTINSAYMC